jgi:hypothetical protein
MNVMQTAIDQIVHVIPVRNHFMSALFVMGAAAIHRLTLRRIHRCNRDTALIPMPLMFIMQMTVMDIIDMVIVTDLCMAASDGMHMVMPLMCMMLHLFHLLTLIVSFRSHLFIQNREQLMKKTEI